MFIEPLENIKKILKILMIIFDDTHLFILNSARTVYSITAKLHQSSKCSFSSITNNISYFCIYYYYYIG